MTGSIDGTAGTSSPTVEESKPGSAFNLFSWMSKSLPCFPVRGQQIVILHTPEEFYNTLIEYCQKVERRVVLASLYLGTGEKEAALVDTLTRRLWNRNCNVLRMRILMDGFRGSRGCFNSRLMLLPLLDDRIPHYRCQVGLYMTPEMQGFFQQCMPSRYNELIGLQHMKVYVFDDDVIISGANLSHDYFTNRQDRYMVIKGCRQLATFYDELVGRILRLCPHLTSCNNVHFGRMTNASRRILNDKEKYKKFFRKTIMRFYTKCFMPQPEPDEDTIRHNERLNEALIACGEPPRRRYIVPRDRGPADADTWMYPLIECPPFDIHFDSLAIKRIMLSAPAGSTLHMATGYFNITKDFEQAIIQKSEATYKFLLAHPLANGFFNARGFAGYIPSIYTIFAKNFLDKVHQFGAKDRIEMKEYQRDGWTYHAKGIWFTPAGEKYPDMTVIGSSNYGDRSVYRDLETQIVVITENEDLKERLYNEQQNLYKFGNPLTLEVLSGLERRSSSWMHYFAMPFKSFF